MKRFAVLLSGCGHQDGSEITEAVSVLIALSEFGAAYEIFAPDSPFRVQNARAPVGASGATLAAGTSVNEESRNVLTESARIARGNIRNLKELKVSGFDGLVLPGGFGAALNLCDWAARGAACRVHPEVEKALNDFYMAEKPVAAICIAPALVARVLGAEEITLTIGNDPATIDEILKTGARHETCTVTDFVSDREHRIITTPAYMYGDAKPFEVFTGIRKALRELVEMA